MPSVLIEDLSKDGHGIAELRNRKIKVAYVLPGEKVRISHITWKGINLPKKILSESPYRVRPLCPYFTVCGGCKFQHIRYDKQLEIKNRFIRRLFEEFDIDKIENIMPSPRIFHYRNKMEFVFSERDGDLIVGLRVAGSFKTVVDLDYCFIQSEKANRVFYLIKSYLKRKNYPAYNILRHEGFLRYLVIRTSFKKRGILINLVTTSIENLDIKELYENILSTLSKVDETELSVYWSINDGLSDIAYGNINSHIGVEYITETQLNYTFRIYPYTFFQTNPLQAERMYNEILKNVSGGELLIDVYSGTGTIGIILSSKYDRIIGIESQEDSVKTARLNIEDNDISNLIMIQDRAEEALKRFIGAKVDTIIFDPPRAGLSKKVIRIALKILPNEIAYVSCNPQTQVRDLRYFIDAGYKIRLVKPIDMFPQTPHVESLVLLER